MSLSTTSSFKGLSYVAFLHSIWPGTAMARPVHGIDVRTTVKLRPQLVELWFWACGDM